MAPAAEREALASWHRPITGDNFCSLAKGVVLSRTYNLIKGESRPMRGDTLRTSTVQTVTKANFNEAFFVARDLPVVQAAVLVTTFVFVLPTSMLLPVALDRMRRSRNRK